MDGFMDQMCGPVTCHEVVEIFQYIYNEERDDLLYAEHTRPPEGQWFEATWGSPSKRSQRYNPRDKAS